MDQLKMKLIHGGYSQTSHVDQPLSFAARGGIVDVYSINYDHPIRIEFLILKLTVFVSLMKAVKNNQAGKRS